LLILPAYNEEDALPGVLAELRATVPEFDVLVVDDGSTDGTAAVARAARVPVARLPFNLGVGGALQTGFRYAVERGYPRVIQFDADGQHDAAEIPALLAAMDDGADMVVGSRFAHEARTYTTGRVRSSAMRVLRLGVQLLSGQRFSDTSSGFRAFSLPLVRFFAENYPVEYLGDTVEALLLACYEGHRVVEVPVRMRPRTMGRASNRNLKLVYHYLRTLVIMVTTASLRRRQLRRAVI
jgi:glycosyltransferase involved in cell wall biosynthesis